MKVRKPFGRRRSVKRYIARFGHHPIFEQARRPYRTDWDLAWSFAAFKLRLRLYFLSTRLRSLFRLTRETLSRYFHRMVNERG